MIRLAAWEGYGLGQYAIWREGQPHLFAEGRLYDPLRASPGTLWDARYVTSSGGMGFLKLGNGEDAIFDGPVKGMSEGMTIRVRIKSESRPDKRAVAALEAQSNNKDAGAMKTRLLARAQSIWPDERLQLIASDETSEALDMAREQALNPSGGMIDGGNLTIEPTRALIAVDVDGGGHQALGGQEVRRRARLNERAICETVRRLRLSGLAGLVVIDLIGRRHDYARLKSVFDQSLAGEANSHIAAPNPKFGTFEFTRPWLDCPLSQSSPQQCLVGEYIQTLRTAQVLAARSVGRMIAITGPKIRLDGLRSLLKDSLDPLGPRLRLIDYETSGSLKLELL